MVTLQGDWFSHFREKEQIQRGLDLLLLIFKDLLYIQLDKQEQIVFQEKRAAAAICTANIWSAHIGSNVSYS
jgi:hypothetical protein